MSSRLLTPRQAAKLVGVSESTVRRWCDAGLLRVSKTAGGHRRIERRELLEFARSQGLALISLAPMATAGRGGRLPSDAELAERFYKQAISGNERVLRDFASGLLERTGESSALCDDVIAPAMHRVGEEWSRGDLRIYREHSATQLAESALAAARFQLAQPDPDAPVAICAALQGDPYSLGPAMCSLVLQAVGFRVTLLGPDTPVGEVLQAAQDLSASLIAISVGVSPRSPDDLAQLCSQAEEHAIRVAIGGRQLTPEIRRNINPDFFGDTMAHLESYGRRLIDSLRAGESIRGAR